MFGQSQAKGLFLVFAISFMDSSLAAVDDCPQSQFWNGTFCVSCTPCPPGFGVKTKCSRKLDTECEACIAGFDYSNTTGFERCFGCDEFSNCHLGNSKEVKKCTKFSPRACDGCQDGNYFNPGTGGCQECSPPCRRNQHETTPCSIKHDRMCSPKTTVSTTLAINFTFPEVSTKSSFSTSANTDGATGSTLKEDPSKSISSTAGDTDGVPSFKSGNRIGGDSTSSQETFKNPWLWIGIGVVIIAMTIFGYKRKKRNAKIQRKRGANISTDKDTRDAQEMTPLMLGLDLPIKDLTIEGKTFIAQRLNGKGNFGYYYWQLTGEELGFLAECKAWESAENPTEKLLKAYGQKEGSTIRNLIEALRQVELTRFAKEIEDKFSSSTTQDQKKEECKVEIHELS